MNTPVVLESRCVSVNGRPMHYVASTVPVDPRPPLVLVHGVGLSHRYLLPVAETRSTGDTNASAPEEHRGHECVSPGGAADGSPRRQPWEKIDRQNRQPRRRSTISPICCGKKSTSGAAGGRPPAARSSRAFPRDFGIFARYHKDIQKQVPARYPMPGPLTLDRLDEFLAAAGDRYNVEWTTGEPSPAEQPVTAG